MQLLSVAGTRKGDGNGKGNEGLAHGISPDSLVRDIT